MQIKATQYNFSTISLVKIISHYGGETVTLMHCDNVYWYNQSGPEFGSNVTKLFALTF